MCKSSFWHVAQLVELLTVNQAVAGSSPAVPANRDVSGCIKVNSTLWKCLVGVKHAIVASWMVGIIYMLWYGAAHETICTEHSIVQDILRIQGRDAILQLSNGDVVTVNQAHYADGDDYCLKYESVPRN